jgi:hypothetical protein
MRDLFDVVFGHLQYDFFEDSEEVQGTWDFEHLGGDLFKIRYVPFSYSPYPAQVQTFKVTKIAERPIK